MLLVSLINKIIVYLQLCQSSCYKKAEYCLLHQYE